MSETRKWLNVVIVVCIFVFGLSIKCVLGQSDDLSPCSREQIATPFEAMARMIGDDADAAWNIYEFIAGMRDQAPTLEQAHASLQAYDDIVEGVDTCYEFVTVVSSRAALLGVYRLHTTLLDEIEADEDLRQRWKDNILLPAAVTYHYNMRILGELYRGTSDEDNLPLVEQPTSLSSYAQDEPLWSANGKDDRKTSVEFTLSPGIYRLNIVQEPANNADWGGIWLDDIVDLPEKCFRRSIVQFPTQFRIQQNCQIYATFQATIRSDYVRNPWQVSITKLD